MSLASMRNDAEFAGRLVIKAQLHDDIRRILIHNEELTYDELILMMQRVFKPKLDDIDSFVIKYKDQDNDYVTIAEEFDLSYAIHNHKVLRLKLFVPQESTSPTEESSVEDLPKHSGVDIPGGCDRKAIITELRRLRDDFNMLAEKLDKFMMHQKHEPTEKSPNAGDSFPTEKAELASGGSAIPLRPVASDVPPTTSSVCPPGPSASLAPLLSQNLTNLGLGQSIEPPPAFSRPSEAPTSAFRPSPSVDSTPAPPPPLQMGGPGMSQFSQPAPTSIASPPVAPPPLQTGGPASPPQPPPPPPQHSLSQQPALLPTTNLPPLSVSQPAFQSAVPPQLSTKPVPQSSAVATPPPPPPLMSQFTPMMMSTASGMVPPPPMPLPGQRFPTTTTTTATGGSGMPGAPPPGSMGYPSMGQMSMHLGGPSPPMQPPPPPPQMQPLQLGGLPSGQFAGSGGTPPPPMFGMYGQRPPQ